MNKLIAVIVFTVMFSTSVFADEVYVNDEPMLQEEEVIIGVDPEGNSVYGPGTPGSETIIDKAAEDLGLEYLSIPLTQEDLVLMARMAYGETMYHDGTCPESTVKACYEVVFNRYLHDANSTDGSLFHKGKLTVSKLITRGQFEGICSKSTWNKLSSEKQAEYINLIWQVHNQGPTVLTTEYLYWQSSGGTRCKNDRLWVGYIKSEDGIVEGTATDKSCIVRKRGNWYRKTYE